MPKKLSKVVSLTIGAGHSIIVGHKPTQICTDGICKNVVENKTKETLVSFGLFGGSNDINKFYPNLSPDDWSPKDADFVEPIFRGLSETFVSHWGIPISFKKPGVLKASMPMLKGVTINTNHDTEVENAVGAVKDVVWQEAKKDRGVLVPAGINLLMKIDAKSNPRLARGIMMDPPSVHSNSVTVQFTHEPSHPQMEDFWEKVGERDKNGKLIHVIVNNIIGYKETSLVHHGADPFAQKVDDDGKINDPQHASKVYDFSEDESQNHFINFNTTDMSFLQLLTLLGLTIEAIPDEAALAAHYKTIAENQIPSGVDLPAITQGNTELAALKAIKGDLSPESLKTIVANQVVDGQVILEEGQTVITEEQTTTLNTIEEKGGMAVLVANGELGTNYLNTIRQKAVADFKLSVGDNPSQVIIDTIMKADLEAAKAFEVQYNSEVEKKFPLTCKNCNSTEVSRATANSTKPENKTSKSFEKTRDSFAKKARRAASSLHQEAAE